MSVKDTIAYDVLPVGVDQDTAARAVATVRRMVPDPDEQADVLAALGLDATRHSMAVTRPTT